MGTPPLPVVGEQRSLHQTDFPDTSNNMTQNGLMVKGPLGEVFKVPEDNRKELESLNKSLNDYISMVQNLDSNWQGGIISRRTTVNVNVDRKTISVNIAIQEELQEIQKKCKKNDGEIAELLGKISLLEGQIREPRKPDLDGFELTNKHLEDEVCRRQERCQAEGEGAEVPGEPQEQGGDRREDEDEHQHGEDPGEARGVPQDLDEESAGRADENVRKAKGGRCRNHEGHVCPEGAEADRRGGEG